MTLSKVLKSRIDAQKTNVATAFSSLTDLEKETPSKENNVKAKELYSQLNTDQISQFQLESVQSLVCARGFDISLQLEDGDTAPALPINMTSGESDLPVLPQDEFEPTSSNFFLTQMGIDPALSREDNSQQNAISYNWV